MSNAARKKRKRDGERFSRTVKVGTPGRHSKPVRLTAEQMVYITERAMQWARWPIR